MTGWERGTPPPTCLYITPCSVKHGVRQVREVHPLGDPAGRRPQIRPGVSERRSGGGERGEILDGYVERT